MGKLFNLLFIFSLFLVTVYSLPKNGTRSATAKKRSTTPRRGIISSAFGLASDPIKKYLKDLISSSGTIKILVWNKSPVPEIGNAKWKAENAQIVAPSIRAIESEKEPAIIVAHFSRSLFKKNSKTVWISYGSSTIARICIYAKIELSKYLKTPTFSYNVYLSRSHSTCDPPPLQFVSENYENGYTTLTSRSRRFSADCAIAAYDMDYVLNVYIMNYPSSAVSLNQNTESYHDIATEIPDGGGQPVTEE